MALAIPLLPVCWVLTIAFFQVFLQGSAGSAVYESPELGLFVMGAALWVAAFFLLPRPTGLYVLGHEWTHAIAALSCGGRVGRVRATAQGGYVLTDKNNVIISLSPYIVPFWLLVSLGLLGTASLIIDIPHFNLLLFFTAGLGWAFHLSFTILMARRGQSDLEINGYFFSLVVIYLGNVLLIGAFLAWISPEAGFRDLAMAAWLETTRLFDSVATLFRT